MTDENKTVNDAIVPGNGGPDPRGWVLGPDGSMVGPNVARDVLDLREAVLNAREFIRTNGAHRYGRNLSLTIASVIIDDITNGIAEPRSDVFRGDGSRRDGTEYPDWVRADIGSTEGLREAAQEAKAIFGDDCPWRIASITMKRFLEYVDGIIVGGLDSLALDVEGAPVITLRRYNDGTLGF